MVAAYGQGRADEETGAEFRTEQELWDVLATNEVERECLAATGVTPQASSAEQSDTERLVDVVAEALRERPFHFGPNTRDAIVRGMDKVWLTGNERRDLARMALDAHEEVARRADL